VGRLCRGSKATFVEARVGPRSQALFLGLPEMMIRLVPGCRPLWLVQTISPSRFLFSLSPAGHRIYCFCGGGLPCCPRRFFFHLCDYVIIIHHATVLRQAYIRFRHRQPHLHFFSYITPTHLSRQNRETQSATLRSPPEVFFCLGLTHVRYDTSLLTYLHYLAITMYNVIHFVA
jgi:hypothetical protein